ncbi:set-15, partial [Pristionchus pacificus]
GAHSIIIDPIRSAKKWQEIMFTGFWQEALNKWTTMSKTMPKLYEPPQDRQEVKADHYEGKVKFFDDLNDASHVKPSFSRLDSNIAMKGESDEKKITVCCDCTDGCIGKECRCRQASSDNVELMRDGRINVKELNGKQDDEKVESGYLSHHIYTCGDLCSCNQRKCLNRIKWEEREGEFEILRKSTAMGFEVRTLRTFEQGEVVLEFIGEYEKNLKDKKKITYSFIAYDTNDIHKSERRFATKGLNGEVIKEVYYLNPMMHGSIGRFVSHSRMMNLIPLRIYSPGFFLGQPRIVFVAALTISYGDFLKVDYGTYFHQCLIHPYRNSGKTKECACDEVLCHNSNVLSLVGRKNKSFAIRLLMERELANKRRIRTMEMNCFRSIVVNNRSNYTKSLLRNVTNVEEQEKIKKKISFLVNYYREHEEEFGAEMAKDKEAEKWQKEMGEKSNDENEDDIEEQERLEKKRRRGENIEREERIGIENLEKWKRKSESMRRKLNDNEFDDDEERKDLKRRLKARQIIYEKNNNEEEEKRRNREVELITID